MPLQVAATKRSEARYNNTFMVIQEYRVNQSNQYRYYYKLQSILFRKRNCKYMQVWIIFY